jgi:hypothetical protein
MQTNAHLRELRREGSGMRPIALAPCNRLIGNIPAIPPASDTRAGLSPPRNIAAVLVRNPDGEAIEMYSAVQGQMKDILMAVIEKSGRVHRLVVTYVHLHAASITGVFNKDGFDPMDDILKDEVVPKTMNHLEGNPRVGRT